MDGIERVRQVALEEIVSWLDSDERFVAAWLAGSFGRGEEDAYSDLDLIVVVSADHAREVCARVHPTNAGTTDTRREIVSRFGAPVVVHEHHGNAPPGGSFTSVVYRSGLAIDWTFIPQDGARRSEATRALFDHVGIPLIGVGEPLSEESQRQQLAEKVAFFWLVALSAAKAWKRQDGVKFHATLELLHLAERDIRALLEGRRSTYSRTSHAPFCPTPASQRDALLEACDRILSLSDQLVSLDVETPFEPRKIVEYWLEL